MEKSHPALTVGLEEELFLIDSDSGLLSKSWPKDFSRMCYDKYPEQIVHEFLNCQIELITKPHSSIKNLAKEYKNLRAHLISCANKFNMSPIACSTHPKGDWREQTKSDSNRYSRLNDQLQMSARRMLIGGMHLHVGLESLEQRVDVFNYLLKYLPVILSLSTSSPFWSGLDSGLNSSRISVLNSLPRSGLPSPFESYRDYKDFLACMKSNDAIQNSKEIWWDVRLNALYPTVEVRIADTCSSINDSLAICALFQCLIQHFIENGDIGILEHDDLINQENRWRAQRFPINENSYLAQRSDQTIKYDVLIKNLVKSLEKTAKKIDCHEHLLAVLDILRRGTSADKQRDIYKKSKKQGLSDSKSLNEVINFLVKDTKENVFFSKKNYSGCKEEGLAISSI